jgi:hypothetical protein
MLSHPGGCMQLAGVMHSVAAFCAMSTSVGALTDLPTTGAEALAVNPAVLRGDKSVWR